LISFFKLVDYTIVIGRSRNTNCTWWAYRV